MYFNGELEIKQKNLSFKKKPLSSEGELYHPQEQDLEEDSEFNSEDENKEDALQGNMNGSMNDFNDNDEESNSEEESFVNASDNKPPKNKNGWQWLALNTVLSFWVICSPNSDF